MARKESCLLLNICQRQKNETQKLLRTAADPKRQGKLLSNSFSLTVGNGSSLTVGYLYNTDKIDTIICKSTTSKLHKFNLLQIILVKK